MIINLRYDNEVPVILWLTGYPDLNYVLECTSKSTKDKTSTVLDNISNVPTQYALFGIVAVSSLPLTPSHNVIFLKHKGEYTYRIYKGLIIDDDNIVGSGILTNSFDAVNEIVYNSSTNNNIVYGE